MKMAQEIERKFLVNGDSYRARASQIIDIEQGYLSREPARTVRVRIAGERAFITIKGTNHGARRAEFEYEIPLCDAQQLMLMCLPGKVRKTRHVVVEGDLRWEVDEFHGTHAGLVVAEVELKEEGQHITLPDFVGKEVTGDPAYYNSNL